MAGIAGSFATGQASYFQAPAAPGALKVTAGNFATGQASIGSYTVLLPVNPEIASASAFRLSGQITVQFEDPIATAVELTANGVPLQNLVRTSATTITATIASGGYGAIDSTIPLVFRDTAGVSASFNVTVQQQAGTEYQTLSVAPVWLPGSAIGDQVEFIFPTVFGGVTYNAQINANGTVNFGGATPDIPLVYRVLDASDSYRAGSWGTLYAPSDPALALGIEVEAHQFPETQIIQIVISAANFIPALIRLYRIDGASGGTPIYLSDYLPEGELGPYAIVESTEFIPIGTQRRYRAIAVTSGGEEIASDDVLVTIQKRVTVTLTPPVGVRTGPFNVQVRFDSPVTGLEASEFLLVGFPVSLTYTWSVSGSGQDYILAIAPPINFTGPLTVTLPAGSALDVNNLGTLNTASFTIQVDTTGSASNPRIVSIGGDNVVNPGETVTIVVADLALSAMSQLTLAGNTGEYAIPFNGTSQVTIPSFIPAGTYTLRLRRFN